MFRSHILITLSAALLCVFGNAFAAEPETIAEFTGAFTAQKEFADAGKMVAMGFAVTGSPTISEIMIPLAPWAGITTPCSSPPRA